jgi:hypothetical protein
MWNGVDIELYLMSHDPKCFHTVLQFLELFQWDKRAEAALRYLVDVKFKIGHTVQARTTQLRRKRVPIPEIPPLGLMVGICPKCGEALMGESMPACETRESGRLFLKVCASCTYYSELFRKSGGLTEIEGE